jgi:hypothetical protein
MFVDLKPALPFQPLSEILEIIPLEYFDPPTGFTQQQVLVTVQRRYIRMAPIRTMDALYQAQLFQLL